MSSSYSSAAPSLFLALEPHRDVLGSCVHSEIWVQSLLGQSTIDIEGQERQQSASWNKDDFSQMQLSTSVENTLQE